MTRLELINDWELPEALEFPIQHFLDMESEAASESWIRWLEMNNPADCPLVLFLRECDSKELYWYPDHNEQTQIVILCHHHLVTCSVHCEEPFVDPAGFFVG